MFAFNIFILKKNTNEYFLPKISPAQVVKMFIVQLEKRIILKDYKMSIL